MTELIVFVNEHLIVLSKICLSTFLGYYLGRERKLQHQIGGSRTFAIISLSACLMTILCLELNGHYIFDFSRIMSYGIAGIGFLGSGLIIKDKTKVEGVTTASALFCLLPINYLIGLGYYFYGIVSFGIVYALLESKYWKLNRQLKRKHK